MKKGSPPPKKYMKRTVKFKKEKSDKTTGKIDMTGWAVPTGCEPVSKTCRGCLKKGHIWINCPDNVEKALVGKDEEGDDWEEEEDYNTFVIAGSRKQGREFTMFLGEEILLDNQASQCIFHNEGLLHGVTEREPYNMCGIDRGQSGLRVRGSDWENTRIRKDRRNCRTGGESFSKHTRPGPTDRRGIRGAI